MQTVTFRRDPAFAKLALPNQVIGGTIRIEIKTRGDAYLPAQAVYPRLTVH
jgi:hypothetical protein